MWALLPSDLIIAVADRLPIADYARFRAVCTAWSSAVKDCHPCTRSSVFPWLYPKTTPLDVNRLSFFDCSEDRYYRLSLPANISAAGATVRLVGHRDGWMVFLLRQDDNLRPIVVNPLSGTQLRLPSLLCTLPCVYQYDSYTIIPYPAHNVAFLLFDRFDGTPFLSLAFTGPGDFRWTHVFSYEYRDMRFKDVVYHGGRFYTISCPSGRMLALNLDSSTKASILDSTTVSTVALAKNMYLSPIDVSFGWDVFLVSSPSGDLLQVVRTVLHLCDHTSFLVMKYDAEADGWAETQDLGGSCIFVDKYQAMLLLPAEGDGRVGSDAAWPQLRRNCIYFAGSHHDHNHNPHNSRHVWDVRVYEVGSRAAGNICSTFEVVHPLFWFRPSFA